MDGLPTKDERYVHAEDVDLLHELGADRFSPRVAVLPPFDNMVYNQARGKRLFDFDYVREQFLPKEKRRFGLWVLPIVRGDQFLGRVDARLDKARRLLRVIAMFAEQRAPTEPEVAYDIREELERLASFLGADSVAFTPKVPSAWRAALH